MLYRRTAVFGERDPHSFAPGDPGVMLTRRMATDILDHLESWNDVVTRRAGADAQLTLLIQELSTILVAG